MKEIEDQKESKEKITDNLNLLEDQKFCIEQKKINEDINGAIRSHKFTELEEVEDFINKFN